MPRFTCSYAYDVPHYFDFTVTAKNEKEALRKCQKALEAGKLCDYDDHAGPCYENSNSARVFVVSPDEDTTNFQLTAKGIKPVKF